MIVVLENLEWLQPGPYGDFPALELLRFLFDKGYWLNSTDGTRIEFQNVVRTFSNFTLLDLADEIKQQGVRSRAWNGPRSQVLEFLIQTIPCKLLIKLK